MNIVSIPANVIGYGQKIYALVTGESINEKRHSIFGVCIQPKKMLGSVISFNFDDRINIFRDDNWKPYFVVSLKSQFSMFNVIFINKKTNVCLCNEKMIQLVDFNYNEVIEITKDNYEIINTIRISIFSNFETLSCNQVFFPGYYKVDEFYISNFKGISFLRDRMNRRFINHEFIFSKCDDKVISTIRKIFERVTNDEMREVLFNNKTPFSKWILSYSRIDKIVGDNIMEMKLEEIGNVSNGIVKEIHQEFVF